MKFQSTSILKYCCEFGQNHTNKKYKDVWSKDSDNQWIKASSNNNNKQL